MCCFSRAVSHVGSTQIFARPLPDDRQALVYSMTIAMDEELAMVLPIPIREGRGEDAVTFVDLSGYRRFFDDLEKCFPPPPRSNSRFAPAATRASAPRKQLTVHEVGDYVASYVPTAHDFERLDPRFRLPGLVALHHEYEDFGFAVFQLKPLANAREQTVQPMAFTFPSRRPHALFFPTLHIHDGKTAPSEASFDHSLTLQSDDALLTETLRWRRSDHHVGKHVKTSKMHGLALPDTHAHRSQVYGTWPNEDTWLEAPSCSGIEKLSGRGDRFSFTIDASAAYTRMIDEQALRWKRFAMTRIDDLHDGLVTGLTALTATKADAWGLTIPRPPTFWERVRGDEIPKLWLSGRKAYAFFGPNGPETYAAGTPGPFQLEIAAQTENVPRQTVRFFFARVPSEETIEEIEIALTTLLDSCGEAR